MKDKADNIFNPDAVRTPTKWFVRGMFVVGHRIVILAQSHTGKSFFVGALATAVAYGMKFLNYDTVHGNVLYIDNDTATDTLDDRLSKLAKYYPEHKYNIYRYSNENLYLDDGSLVALINSYKDKGIVLCIVDSLHSVLNRLDPNQTKDMGVVSKFFSGIEDKNLTLALNHHISDKCDSEPEYLMNCPPRKLSMGSSRIIEACDNYYVLASPDTEGILKTLYFRPIPKRVILPVKPMILKLHEDNDIHLEYITDIASTRVALTENEKVIYDLFENIGDSTTVNDAFKDTTGTFGIQTARDIFKSLRKKGFVDLTKTQHNKYHYVRIK